MKEERLKEIDILRAIAFIFVVEQHTMGSNYKENYFYNLLFKFLYTSTQLGVQLFLCISGLTLIYIYSKKFNLKNYYKKRFTYILIPYIICSILCMTYYHDFNNILMKLISGDGGYHLWYMGMIIRLFIYFPIILWIAKKVHAQNIKIRIAIFILIFIVNYEISVYQSVITNNIIHFVFNNPTKLQERFINITPLLWSSYFIIGVYIGLNYKSFKKIILQLKIPVTIIYITLFVYQYLREMDLINFQRPLYLLYCVFSILFWYMVSMYLSEKAKIYAALNLISKYSFAAYMIHTIIIWPIKYRINLYLGINNPLFLCLGTWFLTVLLSTFIVKLISYIPYSQFITGIKKSQPAIIKPEQTVAN